MGERSGDDERKEQRLWDNDRNAAISILTSSIDSEQLLLVSEFVEAQDPVAIWGELQLNDKSKEP